MTTRREALARVLAAAAAVVAGGAAGCASVPVLTSSLRDGRIRVPLADFDGAAGDGGALLVEAPGLRHPVILLRDDEGAFTALSSECTHQGCRVRPGRAFLSCPCHGSTFDRAGRVIRGPARDPLTAYPLALAGDAAEIDLTGEVLP